MKFLFLGLQYDRSLEVEYLKKSNIGLQGAPNTFQWAVVDGFIENGAHVQLFNTVPVGAYPKYYNELRLPTRDWEYRGIQCTEIGYANLPVIKQVSRKHGFIKHIKKWIESSDDAKTIVAYSPYVPFLQAFRWVKRHYPEVKVSVIITDLYGKNGLPRSNRISAVLFELYRKKIDSLTKYVDSFTLLTEAMKVPLGIGKRPYTIVEGVYGSQTEPPSVQKTDKKVILYTGSLNYAFGIEDLLNAFSLIDSPDYELWVCGEGEAKEAIIEMAKEDSRIKFYGFVPKMKALELQQQATVLINPRKNDMEYTKYSFPSKTIEYMASGIPVVMYKLDGIPDEYDEYLSYIEGDSTEDIKKALVSVCELPAGKRAELGKRAKEFILNEKNCKKQVGKILEMLVNQ